MRVPDGSGGKEADEKSLQPAVYRVGRSVLGCFGMGVLSCSCATR
jgi:hypothetical protein